MMKLYPHYAIILFFLPRINMIEENIRCGVAMERDGSGFS